MIPTSVRMIHVATSEKMVAEAASKPKWGFSWHTGASSKRLRAHGAKKVKMRRSPGAMGVASVEGSRENETRNAMPDTSI